MPLYEDKWDRRNEQLIIKTFIDYKTKNNGYAAMKLPAQYRLDFAVANKRSRKIAAFAEVKARNCEVGKFESYMISMGKVLAMDFLSRWKPTFLVVGWSDEVRYWKYRAGAIGGLDLRFSGRTVQTRCVADVEPCAYIPIEAFSENIRKEDTSNATA